jgi:predicted LPLAT superfamily acyltransferase
MSARPADPDSPPRASDATWVSKPERGSVLLARAMTFVSLRLGRPVARMIVYFIAGYFFLCAPSARRASRKYLRHALGRDPSARDCFRHLYVFAVALLDRMYLLHGRFGLFTVTSEGVDQMRAAHERGCGAFLLGAHLGSFEFMSAVGRQRPGLRVAMAMYAGDARRQAAAIFRRADALSAPEIIPLGQVDAMLRIRDRLDCGTFVGMLADRTIGEAPAQVVSFLGAPALFPSGPMRAAAAMRRPVIFMTGLYRGGNRYHAVFHQIADFSQPAPGGREAAVREGIARYVALLETYCRSDPYNWFNFYDFWHGAPV